MALKSTNDKLTSQLKDNLDNNTKDETIKKKS